MYGVERTTVVVTGAAGFIGCNLVNALLARGDRVIGVDNFNDFYTPAVKRANVAEAVRNNSFTLAEADICDRNAMQSLLSQHKPDMIVHLAAWAGVRPSLERPAVYVRNNVEGTTTLLELARALPKTRFILASSSSVYGGNNTVPFREDMNVDQPISVYAATKRACEIMAHTYHTLYGMDIWCLRFFTCYGPAQRPDLAIHRFTRLIDEGKPITVYGDGSTTRDYLYIDDCVAGVIAAMERCKGFEIINLGEEQTVRLDRLIELVSKAVGKPATLERQPVHPGDMLHTRADVTKARRLLGYQPHTLIEAGIDRFMKWYRENSRK